jgi:hypothetical protein
VPVRIEELHTEIAAEEPAAPQPRAAADPADAGWARREALRVAQERLLRERLRTRAEGFSD